MTRPVFLITLGAIAGAVVGMINSGGEAGHKIGEGLADLGWSAARMLDAPSTRAAPAANTPEASHFKFSACLRKSGQNVEQTLLDLVEFHEHDATLALVGCLLDGEPSRFCAPSGRQQAADAMEIYLWSRDDARRTSPAHGLAAKIHLLDRSVDADAPGGPVDPFMLTWMGPADKAIFDRLRDLAKQGYLDPGAFAFSGRAELREALRGVTPEATPCVATAQK